MAMRLKLKIALIGASVLALGPLASAHDLALTGTPATRNAVAGRTLPWPAPIGHRQPRTDEIPGGEQVSATERQQELIFDGQFFLRYANEAAVYAKSLAKPVDRIVLSHIHLDHWSRLSVLTEHFPEAPIFGLAGIADYLQHHGQKILDARRPDLGDKIPRRPTIPSEVLPEGKVAIDGVNFEFKRFVDAESALQLVALMPAQRTLLAFDLAFAPDEHVFTVTPYFDNWIDILRGLNALPTYDVVLSGHGEPTDRSAIDATMAYLRKGKEMYAGTRDPEAYASGMKMAFPGRRHPGWIDLSASLLYGVIDAYVTDT
jgi:glyoxylase-like metal-dependent hydrolase (beta-lactamase superfamily II)